MNGETPTSGDEREGADAAALARYAGALRTDAVWATPPADLADRIIAQVNALREGNGHAGPRSEVPAAAPVANLDVVRSRRTGWSWRWAAAAAAVAALAFAAGALLIGDDDGRDRAADAVADVELTPTEAAADASAAGTIIDAGAGYSISIEVTGLPPAPEGEYYEGWLHDADTGDWVSVGTFHMRDGDSRVVLWSGVSIWRYAELLVTSEAEGSSDDERGEVLLAGPVQRR